MYTLCIYQHAHYASIQLPHGRPHVILWLRHFALLISGFCKEFILHPLPYSSQMFVCPLAYLEAVFVI